MDQPDSSLAQVDTTTHQDHVIAHVMGTTVLGWFLANEAAHLLLDIGFLWTVYLDAEMNLLPQGVAIAELDYGELSSADKTELSFDAQLLLNQGREATDLKRFTAATVECLVTGVELFASDSERRLVIHGDDASIEIETWLEKAEIRIDARPVVSRSIRS